MNITTEDMMLVESYLDGNMPEEAKIVFEQRMENEKQIFDYYIFRTKARELIAEATDLESSRSFVKNTLKKQQRRNRLLTRYSVAAGILIILGFGGTTLLINGNKIPSYSENKADSTEFAAQQIHKYIPEGKGDLYETQPSYSETDSVRLSFEQGDSQIEETRLIVREAVSCDTLINVLIPSKQQSYLIMPGRLAKGQYEWLLGKTGVRGKFSIQ